MIDNFQRYFFAATRDNDGAIRASGEVFQQRPCRVLDLTVYWALLACCRELAERLIIIDIVKDQNPLPSLPIPEPIFNQLKYISLRILTSGNPDLVRNLPETLLKPGCVARMHPENPCRRRFASDTIGIFDGKLRFPFVLLAISYLLAALH